VIEIRHLDEESTERLADFLEELDASGAAGFFHPHAFTQEAIKEILAQAIRDQYYIVLDDQGVVAYGMLRGWDEGYDIPSLGIALSGRARGSGLADLLMRFLHHAAREAGATRVRLTVYAENLPAVRLFERCGYVFEEEAVADGRLTGFKEL
jgi:RimJ/RimL family protein N-acetyltransferase